MSSSSGTNKPRVAECCVRFLAEELTNHLLSDLALGPQDNPHLTTNGDQKNHDNETNLNNKSSKNVVSGDTAAASASAAAAAVAAAALQSQTSSTRDDLRSLPHERLESCGFDIGYRLVERCLCERRKKRRLSNLTAVMKFICKEFWTTAFTKQINKLQTNRQGTFVLTDSAFHWVRDASAADVASEKREARQYLALPSGMIRGALANLRVEATVVGDIPGRLPEVTFTIQVQSSNF